jgi:hypothetical protein
MKFSLLRVFTIMGMTLAVSFDQDTLYDRICEYVSLPVTPARPICRSSDWNLDGILPEQLLFLGGIPCCAVDREHMDSR